MMNKLKNKDELFKDVNGMLLVFLVILGIVVGFIVITLTEDIKLERIRNSHCLKDCNEIKLQFYKYNYDSDSQWCYCLKDGLPYKIPY